MANRLLTDDERERLFAPLVKDVRERLGQLSDGDVDLLWALRRKLAKELSYDERGKPMQRRMLKLKKAAAQKGLCVACGGELPESGAVLDRLEAMGGYTAQNTRLICVACDTRTQQERGYK